MAQLLRDRFFLVRLARDEKKVQVALLGITLLLLLLLGNSMYLTIQSIKKDLPANRQGLPTNVPLVSQAVSTSPIYSPTSNPSYQQMQSVSPGTVVKEYFIPLGTGSSTATDWTDVPGLTAQIDFGNYSAIKEIYFEASVGIPTANENASIRLFNVTDKHPVWYSEITLTNGQFISSSPLIYDKGVKTYQVQMKTSLQFLANLTQSRIHIILQ